MLEPLTALGLASNIIQLLDFSAKVASESRRLIDASSNALPYVEQVEQTTRRDHDLSNIVTSTSSNQQPYTREEAAVISYAEKCRKEAQALLAILAKLKLRPRADGTKSKTMAIWKAFSRVRKTKAIEGCLKRLQNVRSQLHSAFLYWIKSTQDDNPGI